MAVRVDVNPELYVWASERSRLDRDELVAKFPKLNEWEAGEVKPTLRQLESFATATRTPVGYLFLDDPPDEELPIPDFRTFADGPIARPSPDLLDTIYHAQQRQEWFIGYAARNGFEELAWVGSMTLETPITEAAATMSEALRFGVEERGTTWSNAFQTLCQHTEEVGVLVMVNGVVGSNTHRKLRPDEFRGFALVDPMAPIVFVNGADTKAAQIFTLSHEIAHVWLGQTGLDNASPGDRAHGDVEAWCNRTAAELLVPLAELQDQYDALAPLADEMNRLARRYKVSTLVILRRIQEAGHLTWHDFRAAYLAELELVIARAEERTGEGGNFYNTQPVRVSKTFARAVIADTLAGSTTYTNAFRMLGVRKSSTFTQLAEHLAAG